MSIGKVESYSDLKNRVIATSGVGAVVGSGIALSKPRWIYKGEPSDVFVKRVSNNLENHTTYMQKKEARLIYGFLNDAVDPEVDVNSLKPRIKESSELSEAIKSNPAEEVDLAIERVFSNPDKGQVREDLINLQKKTKSDKLYGRNTAIKLVNDNFDPVGMKLKRSKNTPRVVYNMIRSTAGKIQAKAALTTGLVVGAAIAALTTVVTDVDNKSK